ncbi:MAG: PilZ domain-containing protein, partial [Nitrospirales bacterium]
MMTSLCPAWCRMAERPSPVAAPQAGNLAMTSISKPPTCPHCGLGYVKRVSRAHVLEKLAGLFFLYPFTCQVCIRRFRRFQFGVRYSKQVTKPYVDQRQFERFPVKAPARVRRGSITCNATANNISAKGCELEGDALAPKGTVVGVDIRLWDHEPALVIEAAVVRWVRDPKMGLEFLKLDRQQDFRLRWFLQGLWLHAGPAAKTNVKP